jgi:hypothetical protein
VDTLRTQAGTTVDPRGAFEALRFTGLWTVEADAMAPLREVAEQIEAHGGFHIETAPHRVECDQNSRGKPSEPTPWWLRWLPTLSRKQGRYQLVTRKTRLAPPDEAPEHCTFDVSLVPDPRGEHGYIIRKRVPSVEQTLRALQRFAPHLQPHDLHARAEQLVRDVFPLLLLRETVLLDRLQLKMPTTLRNRVPRKLSHIQRGPAQVEQIDMTWLAPAKHPISPLDFAIEAAELLAAMQRNAGLMHLDLRDDNIVITESGVGFVDFGSAVLIDEDLATRPMLHRIIHQMLGAIALQRALGSLITHKSVTHPILLRAHAKPEPIHDLFALTQLARSPHTSQAIGHLIQPNAQEELAGLNQLADELLIPADVRQPITTPIQLVQHLRTLRRSGTLAAAA